MACLLNVYLLPSLTFAEEMAGGTVVVIDVLRATTTITHALAAGAKGVMPVLNVEEARSLAQTQKEEGEAILLGGERGGVLIEGFDLGNSPQEYTPERVAGKTIIFTTTNGTKAMMLAEQADHLLLGAFVNFSALCTTLTQLAEEEKTKSIHLLCAGTENQITREDVLLAGAIASELQRNRESNHDPFFVLNDQAEIAADAWRSAVGDLTSFEPLSDAMRRSRGGRNMIDLGQERDIDFAATMDQFDIVPQFDKATRRVCINL